MSDRQNFIDELAEEIIPAIERLEEPASKYRVYYEWEAVRDALNDLLAAVEDA